MNEPVTIGAGDELVRDPDGFVIPGKRKRRTRAEIEAASGGNAPHWVQDEMTALKACLKQLRGLDGQARTRILALLKAVFE